MGLNTIEIMNKGINCLLEKLGVAEAEQFILQKRNSLFLS